MKRFQYPLRKVQQVREIELTIAGDALREMEQQIAKVETLIQRHVDNIQSAHARLADSENRTGDISLELRSATKMFVTTLRGEQRVLEQMLVEMRVQRDALHQQLVEKKQGSKMLEKHEQRLASKHEQEVLTVSRRESDELWLARVGRQY